MRTVKVCTEHWHKPGAGGRWDMDWDAWAEGHEEMGMGHGPTRTAAIQDLLDTLEAAWDDEVKEEGEHVD